MLGWLESQDFLFQPTKAKARGEPQVLARSCLACLVVLLACSGAFALSLLAEVALEPTGQLSVAVEGDARCSAD